MPAKAPPIAATLEAQLACLGEQLRGARKRQKVAAVAAAQAAGISRITLHRIERGEPTVAVGAWAAAAGALGLALAIVDPAAPTQRPKVPKRIQLSKYPQLKKLAWQLQGVKDLSPREALDLYERNWRHVDPAAMTEKEAELVDGLTREFGGGRLLV